MGDPKRKRKKYSTHKHPWIKNRIETERNILKKFGLKNKKEILRTVSEVKRVAEHAKHLIRERIKGSKQVPIEENQLLGRLDRLKLLSGDAKLENVLDISMFDLLERRLQTVVYKKGLARSVKQARQFIVHGHIEVNGKKITVPSFLVSKEMENKLSYVSSSPLYSAEHSERTKAEKKLKVKEEKSEEEKLGDEFKDVVESEESPKKETLKESVKAEV